MKRVKLIFLLLPVFIIVLIFPSAVCAETKTFTVTQDTYANSGYPDQPRGSVGSVIVSNKHVDRLGYIQFEDINLPEDAILGTGVLKFYVHEVNYADEAKINIGPVTEDWDESTLTWNNKPTIDQSMAVEAEIELTTGWKEIPITYLVRQWLEEERENQGIFIYPFGFLYGTAETEYAFSLKSKNSGDNPAVIEVSYSLAPTSTPTPTLAPTLTPTLIPTANPTLTPTSPPEPTLEPSPTLEEEIPLLLTETAPIAEEKTPTPSLKQEETPTVVKLNTGQVIIIILVILFLVGAAVAFALSATSKKSKKEKKNS